MKCLTNSVASAVALSIALSAGAVSALAQNATQPAADDDAASVDEVVVTGTRLRVTGFDAPTPTQMIDIVDIQQAAPKMIDDYLNQIPSISGSMTVRARAVQASNGTNGISSPSLRSIGTNRTLVLLDGQRSVPVTTTGETDVLSFPSQLVQRVDVVTGGASALYGSDALAGVVNFILDKNFTGFKFEVAGGMTTYGDDRNYKAAATYGVDFASDRGHLLLSGEYQKNNNIGREYGWIAAGRPPERDWMYGAPQFIQNPACVVSGTGACSNGVPRAISTSASGVRKASASGSTPGGIITSGPLMGTAFDNAGVPYAFNYGVSDGLFMLGGDWQRSDVSAITGVDPYFQRANGFVRADYDVTDNVNLFVQAQHSESEAYGNFSTRIWQGGVTPVQTGQLLLRTDNAYLRQALASDPVRRAALDALYAANPNSTVTFGKVSEAEALGGAVERTFDRFVVGGRGELNLGARSYDWNFYVQHGQSKAKEQIPGSFKVANFTQAIDAVVGPNGSIVCRSTLTNPGNGCVPLNLIGYDAQIDEAARAYSFGRPQRDHKFTQEVISFDLAGEPFDLWAGPLSVAIGAEHRREEVVGSVDPISAQGNTTLPSGQADALNGWSTNFIPLNGKYHVTEGFLEFSLPLLTEKAFAKSLKVDAAVRQTDYSISGMVTTWKAGAIWQPVDDIRFRLTQSRDIRAPALGELFTKGLFITSGVNETVNGVTTGYPQSIGFTTGSTDLVPEEADTTGVGIVLRPRFLPAASFSVDWYHIEVKDAIGTLPPQTIVTQCSLGRTLFCPAIIRNASGGIVQVNSTYFNFASQEYKGVDFEASYRFTLPLGSLSVHAFATHFIQAESNDGISPPVNYIGDHAQSNATPNIGSLPKWKYRLTSTLDAGKFALTLTGRGASSGTWGNNLIECSTACPATVPNGFLRTVDENHAPSSFYVDATFTYKPEIGGYLPEFFINSNNLFNRDPGIQPRGLSGLAGALPTNSLIYDTLGRTYSAGVRMRF